MARASRTATVRVIFSAEDVRLILTGRKSQARRLAIQRKGLDAPSLYLSENERLRTTTHREGRVYPLERYARGDELRPEERMQLETGKKKRSRPTITIAHIRCTSLQLQRLGDMDLREAQAEGFKTSDEFRVAWVLAHEHARAGKPPKDDQVAWMVRRMARGIHDHRQAFVDCSTEACDAVLRRFDTHHAATLVWAFSFAIVETPRLLKASASFDDYTDRPSKAAKGVPGGEPEALTEDQWIALTRFAAAKHDANKAEPLLTHAQNMARELDELRSRMDKGFRGERLAKLLLAADRNIERIRQELERAA